MSVLTEMKEKMEKSGADLRKNEGLLKKLTAMAIHPKSKGFDEDYKRDMFAAIGRASVNVIMLKGLYAHQQHNIKAIKRNEFWLCPLIALIKLMKLLTGRKS